MRRYMNKIVQKVSTLVMVTAVVFSVGAVAVSPASAKPIPWNLSICLTRKPTLSKTTNSTHPCVLIVQKRLKNKYRINPGPLDGIFGTQTKNAVKVFQGNKRIAVDGIVGPRTWDAFLTDFTPGD